MFISSGQCDLALEWPVFVVSTFFPHNKAVIVYIFPYVVLVLFQSTHYNHLFTDTVIYFLEVGFLLENGGRKFVYF